MQLSRSYGGSVANIIATSHPSRVEKLILLTTMVYIDENLMRKLELTRDVSLWPEEMQKPFVELYGYENFSQVWSELVDYFQEIKKVYTTEMQTEVVGKIKTPTLIFHGERDFFVDDVSLNFFKYYF